MDPQPLRLALAQMNATVGDLAGNARRIAELAQAAYDAGAQLVAFPELALTGYPPEDLVLRPGFVRENLRLLQELASRLPPLVAVVGFVDAGEDLHNAAAVLAGGQVRAVYHKALLPNYGVFDELRYFAPGRRPLVVAYGRCRIGITICEDIWYPDGPMRLQGLVGGAQVVLNLSSSPYHQGKILARERMLCTRAWDYRVAVVFVNLVGGQDELVFDGTSAVIDPDGRVVARAPSFEEALLVADLRPEVAFYRRLHDPRHRQQRQWLELSGPTPEVEVAVIDPGWIRPSARAAARTAQELAPTLPPEAEVYGALCLGLRDYVRKNGFETVVVGLSGGIDSSLVATIAADALGPDRVVGVAMPSRFSSPASLEDARALAGRLGIRLEVISIEPLFQAYESTLAPWFEGRGFDVTEENLQARIRGNLLMALSNKFGWLVLATGNKSEVGAGYGTLYGDMAGGFSPLKDVSKTLVYRLARWRNARDGQPVIPASVLEKPPSAELRPRQLDTDTLPPYEVLDPLLQAYVEEDEDVEGLVARGFDPATAERVAAMVARSEYKRRQSPPGVKITARAFGRDWRFPITNRYRGKL